VVLKLAGEMGESAREYVQGVCGVSCPLDLAVCAHRIADPDNRLYEARFVRKMRARLCATGRYRKSDFAGLRTVMELDDRFTAPSFGFGGAAHYYCTQSATGYLEGLRVPVLLIQAKDDTFVPFSIYESAAVRSNPWIQLVTPECGGHLGFLGRAPHRFWADEVIMKWVEEAVVNRRQPAPSEV
jgi:predicted alpha/beta-fold hydrolase